MTLFAGEPAADPWVVASIDKVAAELLSRGGDTAWIPVVADDGRSGSGKSTTAQRQAAAVPAPRLLHTDDIACHHWFFDCAPTVRDSVLQPLRQGVLPITRAFREDPRG
jgi:hypothetical protein